MALCVGVEKRVLTDLPLLGLITLSDITARKPRIDLGRRAFRLRLLALADRARESLKAAIEAPPSLAAGACGHSAQMTGNNYTHLLRLLLSGAITASLPGGGNRQG